MCVNVKKVDILRFYNIPKKNWNLLTRTPGQKCQWYPNTKFFDGHSLGSSLWDKVRSDF